MNKNILIPIIILILIAGGSLAFYLWPDEEVAPEEDPIIPEEEEELEEVKEAEIINVSVEEHNDDFWEVVFSETDGKEIFKTAIKENGQYVAGLEDLSIVQRASEDTEDIREYIVAHKEGIKTGKEKYYFLLADSYGCGATGNCLWIFYKYDVRKEELLAIEGKQGYYDFRHIFGFILKDFLLSPNEEKVAIASGSTGGWEYKDLELTVLDVYGEIINNRKIGEDFKHSQLNSAEWINEDCLILKTEHRDGTTEKILREYEYCYSTDTLEIINEEQKELPEG